MLAVAVREGLPIAVAGAILDEVGQPISDLFPDGADAPPEQQLRDFQEFLRGRLARGLRPVTPRA